MAKTSGYNTDITDEQRAKLEEIFPEVFSEGKVDWNKLKATLGEEVDLGERYGLSWKGKSGVFGKIQEKTVSTLHPQPEESVDWDTTQNMFIEGDNLEALKVLHKAYYGKIKMIYIDPPYNTGNDFVYNDNFAKTKRQQALEEGAIDEEGNVTRDDGLRVNTGGHKHSNWLNMIYPRLFLARNLLKKNGAIFVSIGDQEVHNLRLIMNEIFGEENFVAQICRITKKGGNKGDYIKPKKDNVLFFFKDKGSVEDYGYTKSIHDRDWITEEFNGKQRQYVRGDIPYREKLEVRANQRYYIEAPDGSLIIPKGNTFPAKKADGQQVRPQSQADKCWTWSLDRYRKEKDNGRFLFLRSDKSPFLDEFGKQSKWTVYKKVFKEEYQNNTYILSDLIDDCENSIGTKEMQVLGIPFDYPKPAKLVTSLARVLTKDDDVVLDFFAGSGSTAQAIEALNVEAGQSCKWIMVQLPEMTDEKSEAFKAGYKTIAEIARERIRRAGVKISKDFADKITERKTPLDLGFRSYALGDSNFKKWNELVTDPEEIKQQALDNLDPIEEGAKDEDLLTEVLLKRGMSPLVEIENHNGFVFVPSESLAVSLSRKMTQDLFNQILATKPSQVILLDTAFQNDVNLKTNLALQAKKQNITLEVL